MKSESTGADPLAVLLLRRGTIARGLLDALEKDPRIELYVARALTPDWIALAQRVAGIIVATSDDPLAALTYVVTAGLSAPIVVALTAAHKRDCPDTIAAGATACVTMPVSKRDVDRIVEQLQANAAPARVDSTLRLLLDPISRDVRYHNRSVRLSQREFALLHCLSAHRGRPVPAAELVAYVWGQERAEQSRQMLDVYVFQLRRKLERLGLRGAISTVRRFGYALVQVTGRQR